MQGPLLQFLADMNISPVTVEELRRAVWDIVRVSERLDRPASDQEILSFARANSRVVVSHDLDFSSLLALAGHDSPSLITLRLTSLSVLCWPVSGRVSWRGKTADIPNLAAKHHLNENQSLEQLFTGVPTAKFLCVDLALQPDFLFYGNEKPSGTYDFLVFIRNVTPMEDVCDPAQR